MTASVNIRDMRPQEIIDLATKQIEDGPYTVESDARTALELIIALAKRLQEFSPEPRP